MHALPGDSGVCAEVRDRAGDIAATMSLGISIKKAQGKREDMKLMVQRSFAAAIRLGISFAWLSMSVSASAQAMTTTTVQGTVYLANGRTGSGTLQVSWPAFTTAGNQAVTAGRTNVTIGADG